MCDISNTLWLKECDVHHDERVQRETVIFADLCGMFPWGESRAFIVHESLVVSLQKARSDTLGIAARVTICMQRVSCVKHGIYKFIYKLHLVCRWCCNDVVKVV